MERRREWRRALCWCLQSCADHVALLWQAPRMVCANKIQDIRQKYRYSFSMQRQNHICSFIVMQKHNHRVWNSRVMPCFCGCKPEESHVCRFMELESPLSRATLLSLCLTRRENLSALGKNHVSGKAVKTLLTASKWSCIFFVIRHFFLLNRACSCFLPLGFSSWTAKASCLFCSACWSRALLPHNLLTESCF